MDSAMLVESWLRKTDGGCRWEQYGWYVWICGIRGTTPYLGLEDHVSVFIPAGSGDIPAALQLVCGLPHEVVLGPSVSWWLPPSLRISFILVPNSSNTSEHYNRWSLWISAGLENMLTPSPAYIEYWIHRDLYTLINSLSHHLLYPAPNQYLISQLSSLISRWTLLYSTLYNPTIMS